LHKRLSEAVRGDAQEVKDGMDIVLCVVDTYFNELYFAGAYRPLFFSDEHGKIKELPSERFSIGGSLEDVERKFETKRFPITSGQHIYLSSDGYYSQFGGTNDKKFMKSRFKNLLQQIESKPMYGQKEELVTALAEWMGTNEQVDDIMVLGIEI
jgi:serine phosphatase RsbU (regulator of sigma subunit)